MANIEKIPLNHSLFLVTNIDKINDDEWIEKDDYLLFKKDKLKILITKEWTSNFFAEYPKFKGKESCFCISHWRTDNDDDLRYILSVCLDNRISPELISRLLFLSLGELLQTAYKFDYILHPLARIDARSEWLKKYHKNKTEDKVEDRIENKTEDKADTKGQKEIDIGQFLEESKWKIF